MLDLVEAVVDLSLVGDVCQQSKDLHAWRFGLDLGLCGKELVLATSGNGYLGGAGGHESQRSAETNAASATGDDNGLADGRNLGAGRRDGRMGLSMPQLGCKRTEWGLYCR